MKLVRSRDIYYIARDIIKCFDPKVTDHGARTAYILYKMLQCLDKYEMYELAEFGFLATIHDLGALYTDTGVDRLTYETKHVMPHSIYGYLYLSYLTPFKDRAKIILYHHMDYPQVPKTEYEFSDVVNCLAVAERMDIFSNILGEKFDILMLKKQANIKYSAKALDLLYQAEKKYNMFDKLSTGEYKQELAELFDYLIFTNEEKKDFLVGLMYMIGFRSEYTMLDTVTCTQVCQMLGEKMNLSVQDLEKLYYAALLHDAGMCSIDKEIIEAPRKLTDDEMKNLRNHVETLESILRGRVDEDILDIISSHHERGDGSGYPRKIKEHQMSDLMKILQVADTITGLTNPRSFRDPKPKEVVISILKEESDKGKLGHDVVRNAISYYDEIMGSVAKRSEEMLSVYKKLQANYAAMYNQMK